jgi:GNAT superfamily N-acetyltransferase
VVLHENECVGYFTLLTDAIRLDFTEAGAAGSRYNTVPAIKLARLGVCKRYERRGIGRWIFDLVVGLGRSASVDIAVRYVSVDALPDEDLVRRYAGWGFVRNDGEEGARVAEIPVSEGEEPRVISMRFDLRQSPDGFSGEHRAGSATAII